MRLSASRANHSPVLPDGRGAEGHGHLDGQRGLSNLDDTPFKYEIAGFTVETTCCVNKKAYKHDVDIPCNAAARRGVGVVVLLVALLCVTSLLHLASPNPAESLDVAGGEGRSRVLQIEHNVFCGRVRRSEHAPRNPCRVLERCHGLAEIVERGAGVLVERPPESLLQPERDIIALAENASRHGHRFAQQKLGFFEAQIDP